MWVDFYKVTAAVQPVFDDGNEDVDRDGDPDLRLYRILGSSEERLDPLVLLDSLTLPIQEI